MKIYTKIGDQGTSRLFTGKEVPKNSPYLRAYGSVDELNSLLGVVISFLEDAELREILTKLQKELFDVGADLATPLNAKKEIKRIKEEAVLRLEKLIDHYQEQLEPLKNFILPGGDEAASFLQVARTVCRRAERETTDLFEEKKMNPIVFKYLNRVSDLLFVLGRVVNARKNISETIWTP